MAKNTKTLTADELQKYVCLVSLSIGWPHMTYRIRDAEVRLNDERLPDDVLSRPNWQLMPADWAARFRRAEAQARTALRRYSIDFGTGSQVLLPVTKAEATFEELEQIRRGFLADAETFRTEHFRQLLQNLREKLSPDAYKAAVAPVPAEEELLHRFYMVWAILPLGGSSQSAHRAARQLQQVIASLDRCPQSHETEITALRAAADMLQSSEQLDSASQMRSPLVQEARERLQVLVDEAVTAMIQEPQQELHAALEHLLEGLNPQSGKRLHRAAITRVRDAFERLKGFAFVADQALLAKLNAAERQLRGVSREELRDPAIGAGLARALRPVTTELAEAIADADPYGKRAARRIVRR